MPINTSCLETNLQTQIDGFTCATAPEDLLSAANSAKNLTTDIESYVALGCELPDLNEGKTPVGSIFYVDELGVPVVAGSQSWLGLDGRTYRKDKPDGQIWSWGEARDGALGHGSQIDSSSPVQEISSSTNWCFIRAGRCSSFAINYVGQLYSWGLNSFGMLGDGTTAARCSPVQNYCSDTNWSYVSQGPGNAFGVKNDGILWVWGGNNCGGLGLNDTVNRCSPVQEITDSRWCNAAAGSFGFVGTAIKIDGTLWSWGCNNWGQTATNDTVCYSSPVQEITSSTNWCKVDFGNVHAVAVKTNGTLWGWGNNQTGQIGDGNKLYKSSPSQEISSATNWVAVSGGYVQSIGIKSDGTLWSWGRSDCGVLGIGDLCARSSPVQEISSSTNWSDAGTGIRYSTGIKTDGTIWSWGCNLTGGLATGDTTCYSSPIQELTSATDWYAVSLADYHTAAIKQVV